MTGRLVKEIGGDKEGGGHIRFQIMPRHFLWAELINVLRIQEKR
jgi:hypothetical protein